jgi:spore maturation protein CgeB
MRIVMFYHSLRSDWNHGNAHFLRGIVTDLILRGHQVQVYEPQNSWSYQNLIAEHGVASLEGFHQTYPRLKSDVYDPNNPDLDHMLDNANLVIVHEWNDPQLINSIGQYARHSRRFKLLFHDTHHRLANLEQLEFSLKDYDGVLAYGAVLADRYLKLNLCARAWIWHEAADTRVFHPHPEIERTQDLVWIGNWGDEERTEEIYEFLIEPARELHLTGHVYGVRYPQRAIDALSVAGLSYGGWIPNYEVPKAFARARVTVHIPRRPYVRALPGIPTIRPFEALACGIPLICSPWQDTENLFTEGQDYLMATSGSEMKGLVNQVLNDRFLANELAINGLTTIFEKHTCTHRVDELMTIYGELSQQRNTINSEIGHGGFTNFQGGVRH